ncbi:acyltransferase family protein [Pseudoroseomonas globiformis]|uniref:Acyltransferase family protein n=1 Tax=Teichococcus globiformis TaxID=2307229 RepID=A0ABV7FZJ1_9PROT
MKTDVEDLPALTSLRFFAAASIVIYHAKLYTSWPLLGDAPATLISGVSFFFALSGFILMHVYSNRPEVGYWQFLKLRLARVWPVHAATFLLTATLVTPATFHGVGWFSEVWTAISNLLLTHAAVPYMAYGFSWNAVSWSISTEFFFYMAFPLLLPCILRAWPIWLGYTFILAFSICFALYLAGLPVISDNVYELTLFSGIYTNPAVRGLEFVLGMATWVLWDRHLRRRSFSLVCWSNVEFAAILAAAFWFMPGGGFDRVGLYVIPGWAQPWYGPAGSSLLFAILIAVFAGGRGVGGRFLAFRPLVWLGEVSFCIYMLHMILFKVVAAKDQALLSLEFYVPLLLMLSAALHYFVELPARRVIRRL